MSGFTDLNNIKGVDYLTNKKYNNDNKCIENIQIDNDGFKYDIQENNDIQKNFSILLNGYPFLKVFKTGYPDIFSRENFKIFSDLNSIIFKITFSDDSDDKKYNIQPFTRAELNPIYDANKTMIESYIKYQLVNTGILLSLSEILTIIQGERGERSIFVKLNVSTKSITNTTYHNDSTLFQILQYNKSDKSNYVLSSELLFYHENDKSVIHGLIEKGQTPNIHEKTMGKSIHEAYKSTRKIYDEISISKGSYLAAFRFKLNNGDTMVFPDTLWKHAVINPKEERVGNILNIKINCNDEIIQSNVLVCSERIATSHDEYNNREIIGLFCYIDGNSEIRSLDAHEIFVIDLSKDEPIKIPVIELDEEKCKMFLEQSHNSCITIDNVS